MSLRSRVGLVVAGLALAGAPAVEAKTPVADSGSPRSAKFKLASMSSPPASVRAGGAFRVRGRVANAAGRRAATARLTMTLRASRTAKRGRWLRGISVKRTKGGSSRGFSVRVPIASSVRPGRYLFRACIRPGSGELTAGCRSKWIRVTAPPTPATSKPAAATARTPVAPGRPVATRACADKGPVGWDVYRRLDRLPELTCGVETKQFSGFDRQGGNEDGFGGVYSCLRDADGCVIAEEQGPGEVQSIWFTRDEGDVRRTGNIKIELDGETVLDAPLQDVVDGKLGAPFVFPLVANANESSGGVYIKAPMPYRESMRVTTDTNPYFFHVTYREFADAEGVKTFDPSDGAQDVLALMREYGTRDPKPAQPGSRTTDSTFRLAPGQTATLATLEGAGMVSQLRLRIPEIVGAQDPEVFDDGRAFRTADGTEGFSEFRVAIDPANDGVRLTRRLDAGIGNQRAAIFVDGVQVAEWPGLPATRPEWRDQSVLLPGSATTGKSQITVRNVHIPVAGTPDFNEFHYWVDSRVAGAFRRTDAVDVGPLHPEEEQAHAYRIQNQDFEGQRTFTYPQTEEERRAEAERVAPSDAILRYARVRISFDGQRTVDAPLGEFFGSGLGEYELRSLFAAMQAGDGGSYYTWWPMPFRTGATVELYNGSDETIDAGDSSVTASRDAQWARALSGDATAGYFRATSNAGRTVPGRDWTFVDTTGRGKFVGVHHTMRGLEPQFPGDGPFNGIRGYLEGDERVHVDGSRTPQIHGTGSEDYYEAGWYFNRGTFSDPMNGNTGHEVGRAGCEHSCDTTYRLMIGDAVPFQSALRFTMEHGPTNDEPGIYGSTAFHYQQPEPALLRSDVLDVGDAGSESAHGYTSADPGAVERLTSAFEGDDDTVEVTEEGRATSAPVRFTVRVEQANGGVRLRRLSDQREAYQAARVLVDGRDVGLWQQPLGNPHKRWLHDTFELPASATEGKRELGIELVPVTGAGVPEWHAARYEALSHVRPYSDREAPGAVTGLEAAGGQSAEIQLSWKPAPDNTGVDYYEVYGSRDAGDSIGPETLLGRTSIEGFRHEELGLNETWHYRVRAVDLAGNLGPASEEASATTGRTLRVEAETLLPPTETTDLADRQSSCCGIRWSGDAQLWFHADAVGDHMTIALDVPKDGTYDLAALHTKAGDYGIHQLSVDGVDVGSPFNGYDAGLIADARHEYGPVTLTAGRRLLRFTVTGKDPRNTSPWAFVGIDVIELRLRD